MTVLDLPLLNSYLNGLSFFCLLSGWILIKTGFRKAHQALMITAFTSSAFFLISYITYRVLHPAITKYGGEWREMYFLILVSHSILAAVQLPFIIAVLLKAHKLDFLKHKKLAVWVFPVWMYVSITGVIIYRMLAPYYSAG